MGSFAHLEVAGYPFFEMKSNVDDTLMTIFDERDRRVYRQSARDRTPQDDEGASAKEIHEYRLEGAHAARRLDVLGFTAERAKAVFRDKLAIYVDDVRNGGVVSGLWWLDESEMDRFLVSYSYSKWGEAIRQFVSRKFRHPKNNEEESNLTTELRLLCSFDSEDFLYGFPMPDPRLLLRAILDVAGTDSPVVLNFSELVLNGYYNGDELLSQAAKEQSRERFVTTAKIIVLTEGSTDAEFLKKGLDLLHPELAPLYSFLDFADSKMEGGAGNLVRIVKGFVAAGVSNRVVALLDNDTAATVARRAIVEIRLPTNVSLLQYPDLSYARHYPTIGPTGMFEMDINGLAGSIELYFGVDVLMGNDGRLTPVQWKGFEQTLSQYQGELMGKRRLQESFRQKLCSGLRDGQDWSGIESILASIFNAFSVR